MLKPTRFLARILFACSLAAASPAHAVTPEEAGVMIQTMLEAYQGTHPGDLLYFEFCPGEPEQPPRILSLWKNAREVITFYHGPSHAELRALFDLAPGHSAEVVRQFQSRFTGENQVLVTNILGTPITTFIKVLDESNALAGQDSDASGGN